MLFPLRVVCGCSSSFSDFERERLTFLNLAPGLGETSVRSLLDLYFGEYDLDDFRCNRCNGKVGCRQQRQLGDVSPNLILALSRFRQNEGRSYKMNDPVKIDQELCIGEPAKSFRLVAVICHRGTLRHGHFWTLRATPLGWVKVDDALTDSTPHVLAMEWASLPQSAYLLLYSLECHFVVPSPPVFNASRGDSINRARLVSDPLQQGNCFLGLSLARPMWQRMPLSPLSPKRGVTYKNLRRAVS